MKVVGNITRRLIREKGPIHTTPLRVIASVYQFCVPYSDDDLSLLSSVTALEERARVEEKLFRLQKKSALRDEDEEVVNTVRTKIQEEEEKSDHDGDAADDNNNRAQEKEEGNEEMDIMPSSFVTNSSQNNTMIVEDSDEQNQESVVVDQSVENVIDPCTPVTENDDDVLSHYLFSN